MMVTSMIKITWTLYSLEQLFSPAASVCTWPTALQDGVWLDSDKGSLTFNATHMSGWRLKTPLSPTAVTDWVCQNSTSDFIIVRASTDIDPLKSSFIAFLCLKMTQISNYSFYYYQHSAEQPNSNGERFAVTFTSTFNSFIGDLRNICTDTPETSEFHMLLKQGFQNKSSVYCPDAFLGMFSYSFNDGSTLKCGNRTELWDVCSDRKAMTFNYNTCTTYIAYSAGGMVYCVNSLAFGGYYYAAVYNTDPIVNGVTTYRFTCLMGTLSGNDVYVSQSPNSCAKTQTPMSIPITANGTRFGAFMYLKAYNICRFESPSASENAGPQNNGAILGGTVGGLLFLAALGGAGILFYLCVRRKPSLERLLEKESIAGNAQRPYVIREIRKANKSENVLIISTSKETVDNGNTEKLKDSTQSRGNKKDNHTSRMVEEKDDCQSKALVKKDHGALEAEEKKEAGLQRTLEQKANIPKTEEKMIFTNNFLFSKEGTGLDVKQQPPAHTAYRQTPIIDTDHPVVEVFVAENVRGKELDNHGLKFDGRTLSIIVTPAENTIKTGSTLDTSLTLSVRPSLLSHFTERNICIESQPESSEQDSASKSSDEDSEQNVVEVDEDLKSIENPYPTHAKKPAKNSVSVFAKYDRFPAPDIDIPKKKSLKSKRQRKKRRKNKAKLVLFRSKSRRLSPQPQGSSSDMSSMI